MKCFTVFVFVLAFLAIANGASLPGIPFRTPVGYVTIGGSTLFELELFPGITHVVSIGADGSTIIDIGTFPANGASSFDIAVPGLLELDIGNAGEPWATLTILPNAGLFISFNADGVATIDVGRNQKR